MPTNTESLYDARSKVFYPFTDSTSYINPYSSDNNGGELITEYNQRNSLNMLCAKEMDFTAYADEIKDTLDEVYGVPGSEVDPITGEPIKESAGLYSFVELKYVMPEYWKVPVFATGVQDEHDFDISFNGSDLIISPGRALIYGYNIHSTVELALPISDVITQLDVRDVKDRSQQNSVNQIVTKFVKLVVMYAEAGEHDERLNPPLDDVYRSVAVVINDEMPAKNELLLGTITRRNLSMSAVGNDTPAPECYCTINPLKTRLLPLDTIAGAENYGDLVNTDNMTEGNIYGLCKDAEHHNITDITDKLWLDSGSNLAKLLKSFAAQPETATSDDDKNTRGLIVTDNYNGGEGNSTSALKHTSTGDDYPALYWFQTYAKTSDASATVEMRDLYYPFAYCRDSVIDRTLIPQPFGCTEKRYTYTDIHYPELSGLRGNSGFMTPQQAFMIETAYKFAKNPTNRGKEYGPFFDIYEARDWFAQQERTAFYVGDYFWVLNDTIKGVTADYGYVTGTVTGSVSGTVSGKVSGTGNVTGEIEGVTSQTQETVTGNIKSATASTEGTMTGNVSGSATGMVTGKWDSFTQHVSTRYACVYEGPGTPGTNYGVANISTHVRYEDGTGQPINDGTEYRVPGEGKAWFVLQAAERGFSIPATATTFGLVKASKDSDTTNQTLLDVVTNSVTGRLSVNQQLYNLIQNGGYITDPMLEDTLNPGEAVESLWYKMYTNDTVTIYLKGTASDWEQTSDIQKLIQHARGHIIVDYTELSVDDGYSGGIIFNFSDVDYITLRGDNHEVGTHKATRPLKFSFDHCVVDTPFFENIGHFHASSFTSGSNTIELNNPWMEIDQLFSDNDYIKNKLYTRFASVTMGEHGITSAMMDMWIQYENTQPDSRSIDYCWTSLVRAKFPPLMCEFYSMKDGSVTTGNIDQSTIQHIPGNLCMKIGATAGVHEVIDQSGSEQQYKVAGNLLASVDWCYNTHFDINKSPAEQIHLNLYMKNSSGEPLQRIANLRFRVPVQITRADDNSAVYYASYEAIYQETPERVR